MRWSLDSQGAVSHVSQDWRQFTGLSEDETVGQFTCPAIHPDDQASVVAIIRSALDARRPFLLTYRIRRADNRYKWAMSGGAPSFAPVQGNLLGYLGSTEILARAPDPPQVTDILHQPVQSSQHRIMTLDAVADHVMAARRIAKQSDDPAVAKILDVALLSIGDLLYKSLG